MMNIFVTLAKVSEIQPGTSRSFQIKGKSIALYNFKGKFYATSNICQHEGGFLEEGELTGNVIMCPLHGWEYNIESGECLTAPGADLKTFPVQIVGDEIQIAVD